MDFDPSDLLSKQATEHAAAKLAEADKKAQARLAAVQVNVSQLRSDAEQERQSHLSVIAMLQSQIEAKRQELLGVEAECQHIRATVLAPLNDEIARITAQRDELRAKMADFLAKVK
jgi:outer membrane protein TolC